MTERQMEDLIAAYPNDFFFDHQFVLLGRQGVLAGIGRFDLLFEDRHKTKIVMELKARALSYADASQVAHYRDELKRQGHSGVQMWLVAPLISMHVREFLDEKGVQYSEIHRAEFLRVAERHNLLLNNDREVSGTTEIPDRAVSLEPEKRQQGSAHPPLDRRDGHDSAAVDIQDLLRMEIAPQEYVIDHLLPLRGKCAIFAPKGAERAYFLAQLVYSIACGVRFFQWDVPQPRQVVHVQGESIGATIHCFQKIVDLNGRVPARGNWRVINRDLQPAYICRIDTAEARNEIKSMLSPGGVLVLDDAITLQPSIEKLGPSEWGRLTDWTDELARNGVSTIIVSAPQRAKIASSARMSGLDSVIILRPINRPTGEDLKFEVEIESIRGQEPGGPRAQPFEVSLSQDLSGANVWKVRFLREVLRRRAEDMIREGANPNEVVQKTGLSRFTVHRIRRRLQRADSSGHQA